MKNVITLLLFSILFTSISAQTEINKTIPAGKAQSISIDLEYADVNDVFKFGLHEYLDNLQLQVNNISRAIYEQYFKINSNFTNQIQNQE